MSELKFVYVTYIATTPEKLWQALTDGAFTRQYWFGTAVESDWTPGSRVTFRSDGEAHDSGEVLDCVPYRRLSYSWQVEFHEVFRREKPSRVTFELEPIGRRRGQAHGDPRRIRTWQQGACCRQQRMADDPVEPEELARNRARVDVDRPEQARGARERAIALAGGNAA